MAVGFRLFFIVGILDTPFLGLGYRFLFLIFDGIDVTVSMPCMLLQNETCLCVCMYVGVDVCVSFGPFRKQACCSDELCVLHQMFGVVFYVSSLFIVSILL